MQVKAIRTRDKKQKLNYLFEDKTIYSSQFARTRRDLLATNPDTTICQQLFQNNPITLGSNGQTR